MHGGSSLHLHIEIGTYHIVNSVQPTDSIWGGSILGIGLDRCSDMFICTSGGCQVFYLLPQLYVYIV